MDEFFDWCLNQAVLPGSKLGTALEYSLKYEETFRTVLSDGNLVLSNNMGERAMKTLVMGVVKQSGNRLFQPEPRNEKAKVAVFSEL